MPAPDDLAARLAAGCIGDGARVVLYSRKTALWVMRAIGFDAAAISDGGIDAWVAEGRAIATSETRCALATLRAKPRSGLFVGRDEMLAAIGNGGTCSTDALAPDLHGGANARYGRPWRVTQWAGPCRKRSVRALPPASAIRCLGWIIWPFRWLRLTMGAAASFARLGFLVLALVG